jgi:PAS domain-containing protein
MKEKSSEKPAQKAILENPPDRQREAALVAISAINGILKSTGSLADKKIRRKVYIDISEDLEPVGDILVKLPHNVLKFSDISKCYRYLCSYYKKFASNAQGATYYSDKTIEATQRILTYLTDSAARTLLPNSLKKRDKKFEAAFKLFSECIQMLCGICDRAETGSSWRYALSYLRDANSSFKMSMEELLSQEIVQTSYTRIAEGIVNVIESALKDLKLDQAELIASTARSMQPMREYISARLEKYLAEKGSGLHQDAQRWIAEYLGIREERQVLEYSDPSQSPLTQQIAAFLLFLWDRKEATPDLRETFERFRSICENMFDLKLRGDVGAIVGYDSRLHEVTEMPRSNKVKLVRPWVEWSSPPRYSVVIRAVADPIKI